MIFERVHKIGIDEVNKDLYMTNKALITAFENTASFYSDSFNYGILNIKKTFLTWFVVDWKFKVIERPKYGDEIIIRNWSRDAYKCFSYMDFEVYIDDKLCAIATSKWVLYNLNTNTYEIISKELLKLYGDSDISVFPEKHLEHIFTLDRYSKKKKIVIRKSDLDFNNHVNNVKYFDYLIDYYNADEYNSLRITYRKEIKADDIVYLHRSKLENKDLYAIIDNNNDVKTIIECEQ